MAINKTIPSTKVVSAAKRLREAAHKKETCQPIRNLIGETDLDKAYTIQNINNALRVANGAKAIGCKIGLTSFTVQKQLGIDQPDFGVLFNDMEIWNNGEISISELMQPKIETEIAFVVGKDLNKDYIGTADVLSAIEYALPSLEIVGSRIENWDIKITDTIADNAAASHFVLGHQPIPLRKLDLVNCKMVMKKGKKKVSEGVGASCLGSPVNAMIWLAQKMAELGKPLRAGDVVLTGALGPMSAVKAGDSFTATIDGLGGVSVNFTK